MKRMLVITAAAIATAAAPARTMYGDALAREQAIRPALAASDALATILVDVRAVVAAYEGVVKQYPASGYSDDALWNAGRLCIDAYAKFGQTQDRDRAVRLLTRLGAGYPTSKFARQVPEQLARLDGAGATPAHPAAPAAIGPPPPDGRHDVPRTIATIRDIRRTVSMTSVRITIELDGEVAFHDEHIANPERVFVDLTPARAAPGLVDQTIRFTRDDDVVRQVRIGRHPNNTTRVVLDAADVTSYSVYPLYGPFRLVIDCVRGEAGPAMLAGRVLAPGWSRALTPVSPRSTRLIADATAHMLPSAAASADIESVPSATPGGTPAIGSVSAGPAATGSTGSAPASTVESARAATGDVSIARQLGAGVSRIVIDAGHGGHDPGAKGRGIVEAELVLDVALRLEKLLQKAGLEVIQTRRTDEFIALQDRAAIANREAGDLFLSIHANASQTGTARGIETYFLNFATNPNAAQVAARENAASALSMGTLPDVVKAIALNTKVDESRAFAACVQRSMVERLRAGNKSVKDLGVKQAPFIVLIGATMPSVLAEISFVTNPQDARLLKGSAYRQRIAEALFSGITRYQASLKNVATVASHPQ